MSDRLAIRNLHENEIDIAIDMAANEGWNPGLDDGAAFFAADPSGFIAGFQEETATVLISAVRYGADYGFIGLYICKPDQRGQGFGHQIFDRALDYLDGRCIGLDAVKEQVPSYAEHGFKPMYRNIRYAGLSICDTPMDQRIIRLGQGLFEWILDYDQRFFPAPRNKFLETWTSPMSETRRGFAFVEDGTVRGYGVLRQCREGFKIGPLFADTPDIAEILFRALAGQVKGELVILDTPEPNAAALLMAEKYEMSPEFETFRMYRGPAPDLPLDQTFGITTFELG